MFDSERAQELAADGTSVILIRPETSPEDIGGMIVASGIVTAVGGRTSHAAVVARGLGRPRSAASPAWRSIPLPGWRRPPTGRQIREGETVAVDGTQGVLALGDVKLAPAQPGPELARLLAWCDERVRVVIVNEPPEGYVSVSDPAEATATTAAAVLVDVPWEGTSSVGDA